VSSTLQKKAHKASLDTERSSTSFFSTNLHYLHTKLLLTQKKSSTGFFLQDLWPAHPWSFFWCQEEFHKFFPYEFNFAEKKPSKLRSTPREAQQVFFFVNLHYLPTELLLVLREAPWVLSTWAWLCKRKDAKLLSPPRKAQWFFLQIFILFPLTFSRCKKKIRRFFPATIFPHLLPLHLLCFFKVFPICDLSYKLESC
jgi:hypothetical protein